MTYNQAQWEAICHVDGPCLVLAGPGSGKTAVITGRTRYLIEQAGIHPEQILVITYTRAAASEMQERFYAQMEGERPPCTFGTFHSVFFSILRRAYGYHGDQVLSEEEKRVQLRGILQSMELDCDEDEEEFLRQVIQEITLVKSECMDLQHYYSAACGEAEFRRIFQTYQTWLLQNHRLDFDDMLVDTWELLRERPDILRMWQRKYRYILIDEFQDINRIQYEIVRLLAGTDANLFAVGDDDQSIYRFRGARPELMLGFQKDYPQANRILLNVNYRSGQEIVEGSLRMIANNTRRFPKDIRSSRPAQGPICIHELRSAQEEGQDIVKQIRAYHAQGIPYGEMAVIFRTNLEARLLVERCMEYNIPFRMRDRLPNCYEHWIARQILAYLRIAMGSRERADYLMIWNRPKRYLRREWLAEPQVDLDRLLTELREKRWAVEHLQKLKTDLQRLSAMSPYAAIQYIRTGVGYDAYLKEYAKERRMKAEELYDRLEELQELARPYTEYTQWFRHIQDYGERLEEERRRQSRLTSGGDEVTLTTMHSAKGLEYRVVFLPGANEGVCPYKKAVKPEELEEERRMFYVAVTRAKDLLHIYVRKEQYGKPLLPSRFVNELRLDRAALRVGGQVRHRRYGMGRITALTTNRICIYFAETNETKTFHLDYLLEQGLLSS